MSDFCVALFGLGTVGSLILHLLLQVGVGSFILLDPSLCFKPENLARHICDLRYLGWPKVKALGEMAYRRNPNVKIKTVQEDITKWPYEKRKKLLSGVNLGISASDSISVENEIAITSFVFEIPLVHVGIHERGKSAECFYWVKSVTPLCYRCWFDFRESLPQQQGKTLPYSDIPEEMIGRVIGEPALGADVAFLTCTAFQWVLAIIFGPESKRWKSLLIEPDQNLVLINGSGVNEPLFSEPFQILRPILRRSEPCDLCGWSQDQEDLLE